MGAEFDDQMMQRLTAFQRHHGMSGDGVAGPDTWDRLVNGASGGGAGQAATGQAAAQQTTANHTDPGGRTDRDRPDSGGEELCGCTIDPSHVVDGVLQFDASEPDGLSGEVEEGEDGAGERQSSSRPAHPVPSSCRTTAKACFSVSQHRLWLLRPGRVLVASFPALGGRPGHETPTGHHSVIRKIEHGHISSLYHAPMELYVQFANMVGFHVGSLSVMSHGCVHLDQAAARRTFDHLNNGDHVDVVD
jgi:hypothetical protein